MDYNITLIVKTVITLITTIITVFVVPWIKAKTTEKDRENIIAWVKIAVAAAEQMLKGSGRGEEKKKYVLEFLKDKGFTLDEASINAAIEAAVKQLNNEGISIS